MRTSAAKLINNEAECYPAHLVGLSKSNEKATTERYIVVAFIDE
jgi:hypothetical protein